jgi:hypothetical protein
MSPGRGVIGRAGSLIDQVPPPYNLPRHAESIYPIEHRGRSRRLFGRNNELDALERSLAKGSVAIQGPIGIGKSSLLGRGVLTMEGFDSDYRCAAVTAVADRDVTTVDQAARLLVERFTDIDESQNKVALKLGSVFEVETSDIVRNFAEVRHLAVLKRLLEKDYVQRVIGENTLLVLAIDEADKSPVPIARLVRSIVTHTQQLGISDVRFAVAGVTPFFQAMVKEDPGISRFFYKIIDVQPMLREDARTLMETKLSLVAQDAQKQGLELNVDPEVIDRVVALSGGHPHILQLLGSHLVEHEDDDPDGIIDARDLANSLRRICYEDRGAVYDSTLHELELFGLLEPLKTMLGLTEKSPHGVVLRGFPTIIDRELSRKCATDSEIQSLVERNVLWAGNSENYALVDEFLRVRLLLDAAESEVMEQRVLGGRMLSLSMDLDEDGYMLIYDDELSEPE